MTLKVQERLKSLQRVDSFMQPISVVEALLFSLEHGANEMAYYGINMEFANEYDKRFSSYSKIKLPSDRRLVSVWGAFFDEMEIRDPASEYYLDPYALKTLDDFIGSAYKTRFLEVHDVPSDPLDYYLSTLSTTVVREDYDEIFLSEEDV